MNPSAAQVDAVLRSLEADRVANHGGPEGVRCDGCGAAPFVICSCCGEHGACAVCLGLRRDGGWSCSECGDPKGYLCNACLRALQASDPLVVIRHYEDHAAQRLLEEPEPMPRLHWEECDAGEFRTRLHGRDLAVTTYRWGRTGPCWIGVLGSTVMTANGGAYLEYETAREAQLAVEAAARLACESKGQRFPGPFHKLGRILREFWSGLRGKADTGVV